jgi:hypothetical protein
MARGLDGAIALPAITWSATATTLDVERATLRWERANATRALLRSL